MPYRANFLSHPKRLRQNVCKTFEIFFSNTPFPRKANLVIGNREELAALYSSMEERDIVGDEEKETRALKEDKGLENKDLEDICKKIAKALFSSPLQKLIVTGGMAPILVVSKDNVSYTEVGSYFPRL